MKKDYPLSYYCFALGTLAHPIIDQDDDMPTSPFLPSWDVYKELIDTIDEAGLFKDGPTFTSLEEALEKLRRHLAAKSAAVSGASEPYAIIQRVLDESKIRATVVGAVKGPQVTRFEIEMAPGVKVDCIRKISSDLQIALNTKCPLRFLLPIPGRENRAGVEVPNAECAPVPAQELFDSETWRDNCFRLPVMLGKNADGEIRLIDLAKAPHLLIGGMTGSGKSVCMNLLLQSLLARHSPAELRLILFDPKHLEFQPYNDLPHLLAPVIHEPETALAALQWAIDVMNYRYGRLAEAQVRDIAAYNASGRPDKLPYIVIVLDELADLMMHAQKEVDTTLDILAAKSRAAGIHLIIATQRPDAKVVTGLVKSNFPWRVALKVNDVVNSRVILDQKGAESLLGNGDMLFKGSDGEPERIQGGWITTEAIAASVQRCIEQYGAPVYAPELVVLTRDTAATTPPAPDDTITRAIAVLKEEKRCTISVLQRRLGLGYNRSAVLLDELEDLGYIGTNPATGLREIHWDKLP
jgi:S-DNA-T family DNA segregation ATPase FtsK/SpoIIIE